MSLNHGLANKYFIKIVKSDWSGLIGLLIPLFSVTDKVVDIISHNEQDDTYPSVRVSRADSDHDGNYIPTTYLKKSDTKNNVVGAENSSIQ